MGPLRSRAFTMKASKDLTGKNGEQFLFYYFINY